jgi:hypothetical protein
MELPGTNRKASRNRSCNLRWKGLYIDAERNPAEDTSEDTALWCLKTFTCLGPDDQVVDQFECAPSRKCYEPL